MSRGTSNGVCLRPLVEVLGDAAYCNVCGAERGEPCREKWTDPGRDPDAALTGHCSRHGQFTPVPHTGGALGPSCPTCYAQWSAPRPTEQERVRRILMPVRDAVYELKVAGFPQQGLALADAADAALASAHERDRRLGRL